MHVGEVLRRQGAVLGLSRERGVRWECGRQRGVEDDVGTGGRVLACCW